jgi:hypothetical protein
MSHSWDLLAELKEATSYGCRCMRLCQFIQQRTFLIGRSIVFLKMDSILVAFFREHYDDEAWWYKIKIKPKVPSNSTHDAMLPPDEAPGEFFLSKLLGITMKELWNVLFECNWARKKGQHDTLVKQKIQDFIAIHSLTHVLAVDMKGKDMMLRVGAYSSATSASTDDNATSQWGSGIEMQERNSAMT